MDKQALITLLFGLSVLFQSAVGASLFTKVQAGGKKCFLEDLPKDTLVLVKYTSTRIGGPENQEEKGWTVSITGPSNELITQRKLGEEGRYAFTTQVGGEHKICLENNEGGWSRSNAEFKLQLDIETGVGATDYSEVARLESLNAMEVQLRQLNDAVQEIISEQMYQKIREEAFRQTSEGTYSRVLLWSVGQTLLLIGSALWQIWHLKHFFHQKKVV
jgi:hypothetical protein